MSSFVNMDKIVSKMPMGRFAVLKIAFDGTSVSDFYKRQYHDHIEKHNAEMASAGFPNSGFDLFVLNEHVFTPELRSTFIDHGIKTEMLYYDSAVKTFEPAAFFLAPRSSISKTPLIMSNHMGIIDSGYRGNLLAAVKFLPAPHELEYQLKSNTRLFQVCHPTLCPIYVVVVTESELSTTARGAGGFGSTGV